MCVEALEDGAMVCWNDSKVDMDGVPTSTEKPRLSVVKNFEGGL